jgi:dTDP-4-dehydrorhamnose 3,5-epimerase
MKATATALPEVILLQPKVFSDARGFFLESYNKRVFEEASGWSGEFVQDNHSRSSRGVLRGLHFQAQQPQGKLVRVVRGAVYDVVVDLRRSSPRFGRWVGVTLSDQEHAQLWIPPGFAHGFQVTSEFAELQYKTTDYYAPAAERCLAWDDPQLAIPWPIANPILSPKDQMGKRLSEVEAYA